MRDNHKLPEIYYAVKNMLKGLNLAYKKIDACENDCMLFYKENSEKARCDICKESRKYLFSTGNVISTSLFSTAFRRSKIDNFDRKRSKIPIFDQILAVEKSRLCCSA